MAERRMFAKSIVTSDAFLDMSCSARCLFYHLGMVADDDGFVGSPKSAMRACGASEDDLKLLITKRFLIAFPSGVVVIKSWHTNNYLQKDRIRPTNYQEELQQLKLKPNGMYTECIQPVYSSYTQYSIGKDSIDYSIPPQTPPSLDDIEEEIRSKHYSVDAKSFKSFYDSRNWMSKGEPIKDWRGMLCIWNQRLKPHKTERAFMGNDDVNVGLLLERFSERI